MEKKQCSICEEIKDVSEFYSYERINVAGEKYLFVHKDCKKCDYQKQVSRKQKDPEKFYEQKHRSISREEYKEDRRRRDQEFRDKGGLRKWQNKNRSKVKRYNIHHRDHDITDDEWISCKEYFNNECAYCGLHISEHFNKYRGKLKWTDFHQEHVDHDGANDLSNCVPSCKGCNSSKRIISFEIWYSSKNKRYSLKRRDKIKQWLDCDYRAYSNK